MVIETSKKNSLSWDAIFSCEGIKKYKLLPDSYKTVSKYLQIDPSEILMVACHPLDLNAAEKVGYKTALVRRKNEWGPEDPHKISEISNNRYDIDVKSFPELYRKLVIKK
jgi:2-haloacid dehalogenase